MKLDFMPFSPIAFPPDLELLLAASPIPPVGWRHFAWRCVAAWLLFAPRSTDFVARLGGLTWKRNSVLSRLAHHRRYRLWQDEFRHQPVGPSGFQK